LAFHVADDLAALIVKGQHPIDVNLALFVADSLLNRVGIFANALQVKHGYPKLLFGAFFRVDFVATIYNGDRVSANPEIFYRKGNENIIFLLMATLNRGRSA